MPVIIRGFFLSFSPRREPSVSSGGRSPLLVSTNTLKLCHTRRVAKPGTELLKRYPANGKHRCPRFCRSELAPKNGGLGGVPGPRCYCTSVPLQDRRMWHVTGRSKSGLDPTCWEWELVSNLTGYHPLGAFIIKEKTHISATNSSFLAARTSRVLDPFVYRQSFSPSLSLSDPPYSHMYSNLTWDL
jgi:hypothetical protein